jgi:hypothetical protein
VVCLPILAGVGIYTLIRLRAGVLAPEGNAVTDFFRQHWGFL